VSRRPILVVEDNPNDLELLEMALELGRTTHPVVSVADGQEALDYLLREGRFADRTGHDPEFVLLDIKMPRVNGLEVLASMRAHPALRGIPVIALTSSREESDIERAYEMGINGYVVKPADFREFAQNIATIGSVWGRLNEIPPEFRLGAVPRH
jgi:CheY-like chemotaxis protein